MNNDDVNYGGQGFQQRKEDLPDGHGYWRYDSSEIRVREMTEDEMISKLRSLGYTINPPSNRSIRIVRPKKD